MGVAFFIFQDSGAEGELLDGSLFTAYFNLITDVELTFKENEES